MVAIPRRADVELTGRARVRPAWRGRLVLQVEERTTIYSACPPRPGSDPLEWRDLMRRQGDQQLHWRDAAWDDMHALHALDLVPPGAIEPSKPWPRTSGPGQPVCTGCPGPGKRGSCSYCARVHRAEGADGH